MINMFNLILYVPVSNFSAMSGQVFLGWTSTISKVNMSCSRTQHSNPDEAQTQGPSVSSQALYHQNYICTNQSGLTLLMVKRKATQQAHDVKQRRTNVDATSQLRIDIDTTLLDGCVPARKAHSLTQIYLVLKTGQIQIRQLDYQRIWILSFPLGLQIYANKGRVPVS